MDSPFIHSVPWIPSLGINYATYVDGLALIFGLIVTGIGALVILYSIYYLSKEREALGNFYVYLLLFMGAMLGVVFSDNIIVLYMFWELTSISSFLLIAYWYQRKSSRYGAQKALLITIFGGFAMLAGLLMLANITDTFSIREMILRADKTTAHPLFLQSMVLLLLGAFTKSAQFPFHIWLPDAMEAPTPISAYLHSATMVKAGIYLIARFTLAVIGSFSMAGLPPFNGFLSKELFFTGVLNASRLDIFRMETWGMLFPVVAWIASIFTFIYCMVFVFRTFAGDYQPQKLEKINNEPAWGMLLPPAVLASLVILFFFFPSLLAQYLLMPAVASVLPGFVEASLGIGPIEAWHGWTPELIMTIGVVVVGMILFANYHKWSRFYGYIPVWFTLNFAYDSLLVKTEKKDNQ
jgi:NADH:ubiquinone oxidoreductase subunit 5 (subunit L)/multisubunit Na+/H+ antiporter MnhA subunit